MQMKAYALKVQIIIIFITICKDWFPTDLLLCLNFSCFANGPRQMYFQPGSHLCQEIHLNTGHFSTATRSSPFLDAAHYHHGARCLMLLLQSFCQPLIDSNKAWVQIQRDH